MFKFQMEMAH